MYDWDDVLIVGDSWCSERENLGHWPNHLLFELTDITNKTPRGRGYPGCSWWSIRNRLFRELKSKPAKVVIIIHTDASRIPSDIDKPFTINSVRKHSQELKSPQNRIIYKAAVDYYNHLYSANFHNWAENQWFLELDSFLLEKQIEKVIHLYGVPKRDPYVFKSGVTVYQTIYKYLTMNTETSFYPNHMTYEHNQKLAIFLNKLITNYPGHGFLYKERPFER
jgi:hypothetical protein